MSPMIRFRQEKPATPWLIAVRIVQGILALISIGLGARALDVWYTTYRGDPGDSFPEANLSVTSGVLTTLVSIYFLVTNFLLVSSRFLLPAVALGLDTFCWIFWLASFGYMASSLGALDDYRRESLGNYPRAIVAFSVMEWLLFFCTMTWDVYLIRKAKILGAPPYG